MATKAPIKLLKPMRSREIALIADAISDETRVQILEFICGCCCCELGVTDEGDVVPLEGPTAGEVCCHITGKKTITSTISFHLAKLKDAGLIHVERRGKYMVCTPNRERILAFSNYFEQHLNSSKCC